MARGRVDVDELLDVAGTPAGRAARDNETLDALRAEFIIEPVQRRPNLLDNPHFAPACQSGNTGAVSGAQVGRSGPQGLGGLAGESPFAAGHSLLSISLPVRSEGQTFGGNCVPLTLMLRTGSPPAVAGSLSLIEKYRGKSECQIGTPVGLVVGRRSRLTDSTVSNQSPDRAGGP